MPVITPTRTNHKTITNKNVIVMKILLLLTSLSLYSCTKPNEPPPPKPPVNTIANTIKLTVEWANFKSISVKFTKSSLDTLNNFKYELNRKDELNNTVKIIFVVTGKDTIYTDSTGLQPGVKYNYNVICYKDTSKITDTSRTITAALLTTTSHDFDWTVDTLGIPGDAGLRDIWGLDENNLWAIGGVTLPDGGSSVIKWNGQEWSSIKNPPLVILFGIYGFSATDIWVVGNGHGNWGAVAHYNGDTFETYYFNPWDPKYSDTVYALNAVWGSSPNDVWAVGGGGTIIHWDGMEWKKVYSPTKTHLIDIWGNSSSSIYAIGSSLTRAELLYYDGKNWKLRTNELPFSNLMINSIWINKSGEGVIAGNGGMYFDGNRWSEISAPFMRMQQVRGNGMNNIFACGMFGLLVHYNGIDWYLYPEFYKPNVYSVMLGIAVFENEVMIVGFNSKGALVWYGKRK